MGNDWKELVGDEVLAYYNRTEFQHKKESRKKWLQEELADGPKNAAEVEKKALTQGMTQKQLRTVKEYTGVSSDKTDFDGGWDLSLPNPNHNHVP